MFNSASDIFKAFLDGIKKTDTSTVNPEVFCRLWNMFALRQWVLSNESMKEGIELTSKQTDDMQRLRRKVVMEPVGPNLFDIPDGSSVTGWIVTDINAALARGADVVLPKYQRTLNIMFKLYYGSSSAQECGLTDKSGWLPSYRMIADAEAVIRDSYYLKPRDSKLYRQFVNDQIIMITDPDIGSPADKIMLDYYKYPNEMSYSSSTWTYEIDLPDYQISEIVDKAVIIYLDRIESPRFRSAIGLEQGGQLERI